MTTNDSPADRQSPLNEPAAAEPLEDGIGLCLSGGGYRAMVFHLGALWRFYDSGLLSKVQRVSSVSGGSITAGKLALAWPQLSMKAGNVRGDFVPLVVDPIRQLAGVTLDAGAIAGGIFLPGSISDRIEAGYAKHLFGAATLQSLPDAPRFVINATNVQSGVLWRFSKPYMGDYRVGLIPNPTIPLAKAVAASSSFPPVLSPLVMEVEPSSFKPDPTADLQRDPYDKRVVLSDGGVYDNMGLETVWKRYKTVFVSDAGAKIADEEEPHEDWARHSLRVLNLIDNQVRNLRKRQLIGEYIAKARTGAYWSIRGDIQNYGGSAAQYPFSRTALLAATPTRLQRMPSDLQEKLINWGYVICDAAIRQRYDAALPAGSLPYPSSGV